ncbi:hypothetical protein CRUP_000369 [Coryphaenoides rupestris]|nr:hypothetical protein CRUP_000369 [Coryphaenoides rupestris]
MLDAHVYRSNMAAVQTRRRRSQSHIIMNECHTDFTPRSPRQPVELRLLSSCSPRWPECRHCSAAPRLMAPLWCVSGLTTTLLQVDSPLNLKHPHDVVIFMRQETRVNYLKKLEKQLVEQKIHIEENEDRDTGLEQRHYKEDSDCVMAKVPLGDLDLYDGTYISLESKDISIHAFQHLRGVQERVNLTSPLLSKEDPIFTSLSHKLGRSIDEVGHRIHQGLLRPRRAVDCVVRALHFSPRQNKDVALVNMANILHRAHFSADAAILAHAALDLSSDLFTCHYTLGNIYAMLGEYNHSVLCYEQALQARPGLEQVLQARSGQEQALRRKHAVLCQQKLEQRLEAQHRSLQRTLNELKEYQKQHDHYLRQQEALDKHKLLQEEQILRNIIHETQMAKEAQLGNHQMCHLGQQQRSLLCPFDLPVRYHRGDLFEHVHYVQFGEEVSVASSVALVSDHNPNHTAASPQPHPSVSGDQDPAAAVWGSRQGPAQDMQRMLWPRRADCAQDFPSIPPAHLLPTFYLTPETQGVSPLAAFLYGGSSPPQTTALPDCGPVSQPPPTLLPASLDWPLEEKELPDPFATQVLQMRSGGWSLDQIGSRIAQALKQATAPRWLLHNEAAVFWRARGNGSRALRCLRRALASAPPPQRHLALSNAANLLPHSVLSLVSVQLAQGNVTGALALFRQALESGLASAAASPASPSPLVGCEQCRASLPLLRCLQFYPSLYNLSQRQPCPLGAVCIAEDSLAIQLEEWETSSQDTGLPPVTTMEESLLFEKVVVDSNGSGEAAGQQRPSPSVAGFGKSSSSPVAGSGGGGGVEGEEEWQLKEDLMGAFEGALDVGGKRGDLRGIRVLKNDRVMGARAGGGPCFGNCEDDDGAEWITFQVKRVRKSKMDGLDGGSGSEDGQQGELLPGGHSVLEISGPTIPSPGPSAMAAEAPVQTPNLPASNAHPGPPGPGWPTALPIHYTGEIQLREVLQNLGKDKFPPQSFEQVGTRIAKVLEKNQTSWVLSSMAALYWRVKGQGKRAIDCLRQALNYAPHHMKASDVPLISLANIFQNARLWEDALTVARMAVEIAPHFVVNHFTLANVYIAMTGMEQHTTTLSIAEKPAAAPGAREYTGGGYK